MSQWIGHLGAIYQYRDVPYVEADGIGNVCCKLCGTGWMNRSARVAHFHGQTHAKQYREVRRLEEEQRQANDKLLLLRIEPSQ